MARIGLVLLSLTLGWTPDAAAQLSPGPLARPHAGLEGAAKCLSCHQVNRRASMDAGCLGCHREMGALAAARRGLHAREGRARCASCHPDHAGPDFALVSWTPDSIRGFDHRRTGWPLEGAHADTSCAACHRPALRRGTVAGLAPGPRPGAWTGLDTGCGACHEDVHRSALGTACADCHDTRGWGPAPRFSHDRTEYPLTGAHREVPCARCHQGAGGGLDPGFPRLRFGDCAGCHKDPHGGRLAGRCADCHQTSGFDDPKPGGFDHGRTRYPLAGRHAAVRCAACHEPGGPRPAFASCGSCHRDAHAGGATRGGRPADCAACHDERGFVASTFTVAAHRSTTYPLEGRHALVRCAACHTRPTPPDPALGSANVRLRPDAAGCPACHADPHRGTAGKVGQAGCAACHTVNGWSGSTLTAARHADLGFPLTGSHQRATCAACHGSGAGVRFRLDDVSCQACHLEPHEGRYRTCQDCHDTRAFVPSTVTVPEHAGYRLPLEGAHAAVPCAACHDGLGAPKAGPALRRPGTPAPAPLRLTVAAIGCAACHQDRHAGQFDRAPARSCEACHSAAAFRPADRFDHVRHTRFALDGRHTTVPCAACHAEGRYRGTPTACEACHR